LKSSSLCFIFFSARAYALAEVGEARAFRPLEFLFS
jgi:hypothetical protein